MGLLKRQKRILFVPREGSLVVMPFRMNNLCSKDTGLLRRILHNIRNDANSDFFLPFRLPRPSSFVIRSFMYFSPDEPKHAAGEYYSYATLRIN